MKKSCLAALLALALAWGLPGGALANPVARFKADEARRQAAHRLLNAVAALAAAAGFGIYALVQWRKMSRKPAPNPRDPAD
jgi:hypothetical protein